MKRKFLFVLFLAGLGLSQLARGGPGLDDAVQQEVAALMEEGDIPGLSLVILQAGKPTIRHYGYADLARKIPVSRHTLFELGSCSKAFTALAVLDLAAKGKIALDDPVSKHIPWFYAVRRPGGQRVPITLRQLLHHTSGIPWHTLSAIPAGNAPDQLRQTVQRINGVALEHAPGQRFEYATVNYDVLGLVIESATGTPYEDYVRQHVLLPLGLRNTTVGTPAAGGQKAQGYKIGFFRPLPYQAPAFRGNNPAGYVLSNAEDVARWMQHQLYLIPSPFQPLIRQSHVRDASVAPTSHLAGYAAGWYASLAGNGELFHPGLNPNFSAYLALRPGQQLGVAVLANANSAYTQELGRRIMSRLAREPIGQEAEPDSGYDKAFSIVAILTGLYLLAAVLYTLLIGYQIIRGSRKWEKPTAKSAAAIALFAVAAIPYLVGIYLLPQALANFSWEAAVVWTPVSFPVMTVLLGAAIAYSFLVHLLGTLFSESNPYKRQLPVLVVISLLSGIANMIVITLITSAVTSDSDPRYLMYYFALACFTYIIGRKVVQTQLIKITHRIIYDLRFRMLEKIFATSFQRFEKLGKGQIYTTLNDDTDVLGNSANIIIGLLTNLITVGGAFLYLSTLAFWATVITILVIVAITCCYSWVSQRANALFEEARNASGTYIGLIAGIVEGFKELSLHRAKKAAYRHDVEQTSLLVSEKRSEGRIRFVNAFLVGESLLIVVLGVVAFAMPKFFPQVQEHKLLSFIVILLYLIGPVNGILNALPDLLQIRIAWRKIQDFLREIPSDRPLLPAAGRQAATAGSVDGIAVEDVTFRYAGGEEEFFGIGPVNFEVKSGEALFIIGGNGSGKSTLAKVLTGLYAPEQGCIKINGQPVSPSDLGEYYSTVFHPFYLFPKLYDVNAADKTEQLHAQLQTLHLAGKVKIIDNAYSTLNLSSGQRKRLALLQCYLEDKPIYLFDEWAADQDPEYRRYFYKTMLPEMKAKGKIVIAITHDDNYFDVADKVIKLDRGKVEFLTNDFRMHLAL
jgi:cyclic peptide transporter